MLKDKKYQTEVQLSQPEKNETFVNISSSSICM